MAGTARGARRPYAGGQFGDPEWVDPQAQAAAATQAGPPPGFPPLADDGPPATARTAPKARGHASSRPTARPATSPRPRAANRSRATPTRAGSRSIPRPTLTLSGSPSVSDGGGFLLGLLAYTLGLNYLRFGKAGVTGWLSAKLLNKPMDPAGAGKSSGSASGLNLLKPDLSNPTPTRRPQPNGLSGYTNGLAGK